MTLEAEDLVATGERASQPDRQQGRLRARIDETHLVHFRKSLADKFCHDKRQFHRVDECEFICYIVAKLHCDFIRQFHGDIDSHDDCCHRRT